MYGRHVAPIAAARRDLWPEAGASLDTFLAAAGLVQSRAFHLEAENWVSGVTQVKCKLQRELLWKLHCIRCARVVQSTWRRGTGCRGSRR